MPFWVLLAIQIGMSVLGYLLRPKPRRPTAQSLEGWFAEQGRAIPIVYGVQALSPNIVWWGDGLQHTGSEQTTFYHAKMIGTLCLGPVAEILDLQWGGKSITLEPLTKEQSSSGTDAVIVPTLPQTFSGDDPLAFAVHARRMFGGPFQEGGLEGDVRLYPGTPSQAVDLLTSQSMANMGVTSGTGRPGVCYICLGGTTGSTDGSGGANSPGLFYFGQVAQPKELVVLLRTAPQAVLDLGLNVAYTSPVVGFDANPAEVIYDLLTSVARGQGVAPALIDTQSFADAAAVMQAEGLGISLTVTGQDEVQDLIDEVKKHITGEVYQHPTTGLIALALARPGDAVTRTITPANARELTVNSASWRGLVNQIRLTYRRWAGGVAGTAITETITTDFQFSQVNLKQFQVKGRNLTGVTVVLGGVTLSVTSDYTFDPTTGVFVIYRTATTEAHFGATLTVTYSANPVARHLREAVALDDDLADQQTTGDIRSVTLDYPYYTMELTAQKAAALQRRVLGLPLRHGQFTMDRSGFDLLPLEAVRITWPPDDLTDAPFDLAVRVDEIRTGLLEDGRIVVTWVEDVWSEDVIAQLPAGSGGVGGTLGQAPVMAIGCGAGDTVVRLDLFPSDRTFDIEIWEADDEAGNNAVLLDTIDGLLTFYDAGSDATKAHRARLVRVGWTEGPFTDWITCDLVGPPTVPTCVLPTVVEVPSQSDTLATLLLTIIDPQHRVFTVEFKHKSGNNAETVFAEDTDPFSDDVVLVEGMDSTISYRVTYLDCDGNDAEIDGTATFAIPVPVEPTKDAVASRNEIAFHTTLGVTARVPAGVTSAETEMSDCARARRDLTEYGRFRILGMVSEAGSAGSVYGVKYAPATLDDPSDECWAWLSGAELTSVMDFDAITPVLVASAWTDLDLPARQDVHLKIVLKDGDDLTPAGLRRLIVEIDGSLIVSCPDQPVSPCVDGGGSDGFEGYTSPADLNATWSFSARGQTGATLTLETDPTKARGGTGQAAKITVPSGASNSFTLCSAERTVVVPVGVTSLTFAGYIHTDFANCNTLSCDATAIGDFGDGVVGCYLGPNSGGNAATSDSDPDSGDDYKLVSATRSVTAGTTVYIGVGWITGTGSMNATRNAWADDFTLTDQDGNIIDICGGTDTGTDPCFQPPPAPPPLPPTGVRRLSLWGMTPSLFATYPEFGGCLFTPSRSAILANLAAARAAGIQVTLNFVNRAEAKVGGVFSQQAWLTAFHNRWDGIDISSYIADGTVGSGVVIDEPQLATSGGWGVSIQLTVVENVLAAAVKGLFPTLQLWVRMRATQMEATGVTFTRCGSWNVYLDGREGSVGQFMANERAASIRLGVPWMWAFNYPNGGTNGTTLTTAQILSQGMPMAQDSASWGVHVWGGIGLASYTSQLAQMRTSSVVAAFTTVANAMVQP